MKPLPPDPSQRIITAGLVLLMVTTVAGSFLPATWLWGLNHGTWLPAWAGLGLPLLGLLLLLSPLGTRWGRWLVLKVAPIVPGRALVAYGFVPVIGAVLFWVLRDQTHMLGDGQTLAVMMAGNNLYHGFDFMTFHLLARIYQAVGAGGEPAAFQVTAISSCLVGALYLVAAAWSSRRLATSPGSGILLYGLLVSGAWFLLFFGYMEVYAPLAVALLVFVTTFTLYLDGRGSLFAVAVAWSVGLFFHLNALFFGPLLILCLMRPPEGETAGLARRLLTLAWPPLAALLLAALIFVAGGYGPERFGSDFGHIGSGSGILVSLTGPEGLFTWRHLKDTVNLFLLLAPLGILLCLAALAGRSKPSGSAFIPLVAGSLWLVFLVTLVHMKLGPVRDWDLFAPHMVLLTVTGWYAVASPMGGKDLNGALVGRVFALALLLAVPWIAVNAVPGRALARLEATSADMSPYSLGLLHEQFAYHHQQAGQPEEVIRHYRLCGEVCPTHPRFHAIYGTHMLNQGDFAEAVAAYDRAVAADSTYAYGLRMGLLARVMSEDYAGALGPARKLQQSGLQDAESAEAHGMAAEHIGLRAEAREAYLRGYEQDGSRLDLLERAAGIQLLERDFTGAAGNFRRLLAARPDYGQAALGLADALWQDYLAHGVEKSAATNATRLRETATLIEKVIAQMTANGQAANSLKGWLAEVNSVLADPVGN